jgi:hypothetical protein
MTQDDSMGAGADAGVHHHITTISRLTGQEYTRQTVRDGADAAFEVFMDTLVDNDVTFAVGPHNVWARCMRTRLDQTGRVPCQVPGDRYSGRLTVVLEVCRGEGCPDSVVA